MEDNRYKIPIDSLELFADPYSSPIVFQEPIHEEEKVDSIQTVEEKKEEPTLLERIINLEKEIDMKIDSLEKMLERLTAMEKKVSEALQRLEYVSKN
jgi:hypothetical protein